VSCRDVPGNNGLHCCGPSLYLQSNQFLDDLSAASGLHPTVACSPTSSCSCVLCPLSIRELAQGRTLLTSGSPEPWSLNKEPERKTLNYSDGQFCGAVWLSRLPALPLACPVQSGSMWTYRDACSSPKDGRRPSFTRREWDMVGGRPALKVREVR
jgi:hypothetical protein